MSCLPCREVFGVTSIVHPEWCSEGAGTRRGRAQSAPRRPCRRGAKPCRSFGSHDSPESELPKIVRLKDFDKQKVLLSASSNRRFGGSARRRASYKRYSLHRKSTIYKENMRGGDKKNRVEWSPCWRDSKVSRRHERAHHATSCRSESWPQTVRRQISKIIETQSDEHSPCRWRETSRE